MGKYKQFVFKIRPEGYGLNLAKFHGIVTQEPKEGVLKKALELGMQPEFARTMADWAAHTRTGREFAAEDVYIHGTGPFGIKLECRDPGSNWVQGRRRKKVERRGKEDHDTESQWAGVQDPAGEP